MGAPAESIPRAGDLGWGNGMTNAHQFRDASFHWDEVSSEASYFRGANTSSAGVHNRKIILHAIRAHGTVRRGALADMTGLTPTAVFKIARDLMDEGLVISSRVNEKARGQPAHALQLNPDAAFTLGLNVDRDHLTLVVLDFLGQVRTRFHFPIAFAGPGEARAFLSRCIDRIRRLDVIPISRFSGIGVAIPDDLGAIRLPDQPSQYSEWSGVRPSELFAGLLDVPVVQENDAASATIGEMLFGAGLELDSFFYVFISAGLGGGLVINRRYIRGAHGRSGEIGFLPQVNPLRSSQTSLQKTLGDAVLTSSLLAELHGQGFANATIGTLEHLADPAGEIIGAWISRVADYLYLPLLTVMGTVDPDAILIGGELPRSIVDALCVQLSKRLSMHVGMHWPKLAVRPASVARDPAAVGAAMLAFQGIWEPDIH